MNIDVSVIIPVFNRYEIVRHTLECIDSSRHPGVSIEVIVVDDASRDGSPDVVQALFPWVILVRNNENKGAPACRNQGLELAKGEFVLFLDSDDLVERGFFLPKVEKLRRNKEAAGAYGPWEFFESANEFSTESIRPRHSVYPVYPSNNEAILGNLLSGWYIPINAVLWRKSCIVEIGGFDRELSINQDVDLLFRMLLKFSVTGQNGPPALIRIHAGERLGVPSSESKYREILQLRERFVRDLERAGLWNEMTKTALAEFCFTTWASIRNIYRRPGRDFLNLYRQIGVDVPLKGGFLYRVAGLCLGNIQAVKLKRFVYKLYSAG